MLDVPPTYYVFPLILVWIMNPKVVSYFWPFVCLISVGGIIAFLLLMFSPEVKKQSKNVYKDRFNFLLPKEYDVVIEIIFLILKILALNFWPRNTSRHAYIVSGVYLLISLVFTRIK